MRLRSNQPRSTICIVVVQLTALTFASLALIACGDGAGGADDQGMDGGGGNAGAHAGSGSSMAGTSPSQAGSLSPNAGRGGAGTAGARAGSGGEAGEDGMNEIDAGVDAGGDDAGSPDQPEDDTPAVRFIGRTDMDGDAVRFEWSGSGIAFRFSGTQAAVRMDDGAGFFTRLVDGEEQDELTTTPGEREYMLASGLTDGTHEIA